MVQRIAARRVACVASAVKNNRGERFGSHLPQCVYFCVLSILGNNTACRAGFCRHGHLYYAVRCHKFLLINTTAFFTLRRLQSPVSKATFFARLYRKLYRTQLAIVNSTSQEEKRLKHNTLVLMILYIYSYLHDSIK